MAASRRHVLLKRKVETAALQLLQKRDREGNLLQRSQALAPRCDLRTQSCYLMLAIMLMLDHRVRRGADPEVGGNLSSN